MFSAVHVSDTINLGAIILGVMVLGAIAYFRIRAGVGDVWQNVAEGHEKRANMLSDQLHGATELIGEQKLQISRLEALPNLERIVSVMAEASTRADDRADKRLGISMDKLDEHDAHLAKVMFDHESRAQERHDVQLEVMEEMKNALINNHT